MTFLIGGVVLIHTHTNIVILKILVLQYLITYI